jgi:hypothetical protein
MDHIEHNATTGEITVRPMTEEELAQKNKDAQEWQAIQAKKAQEQEAKAALLEKLGITADEAALLLG